MTEYKWTKKSRLSRRFKRICGGISGIFFSRVRILNSTVHSRRDYGCGLLFRFLTKISVPRAHCSFLSLCKLAGEELWGTSVIFDNEFKLCTSGLTWSAIIKRVTFRNYLHNVRKNSTGSWTKLHIAVKIRRVNCTAILNLKLPAAH